MLIENNPVYEKYPPSRRHSTNNQSIKIIKFNITVNTDSKKRLKYFCNVAVGGQKILNTMHQQIKEPRSLNTVN